VLRIISNHQKPVDVDRLLVVTFTESAAAEMKRRIAEAISERISKLYSQRLSSRQDTPDIYDETANEKMIEHLSRQSLRMGMTNISTIHSFCRKLLKQFFFLTDIDPDAKICDEIEAQLLRAQSLENIFEESYAAENNHDFLNLVEAYGGGKTRDDELMMLVARLSTFVESSPFPDYTLDKYLAMFNADSFDGHVWVDILRNEIRRQLLGTLDLTERSIALCREPFGPERYEEALQSDRKMLLFTLREIDGGLEDIYLALNNVHYERLYVYRGKQKEALDETLQEKVKSQRDDVKKMLGDLKDMFVKPPAELLRDVRRLRPYVGELISLTRRYRAGYERLKRERSVMDFGDLERQCIKILLTNDPEDPRPTDAAREIAGRFEEIMIDEYQDSNEVQELILKSISNNNRFMVGDVKQSIYKFRRANPGLFIEKYERFGGDPGAGQRIDLLRNFRSRAEVINSVNLFFTMLMTKEIGEIDYDDHAALYPGAQYLPNPQCITEVNLVEYTKPDKEDIDEAEEISKIQAEAEYIAHRIKQLLNPKEPLLVTKDGELKPVTPSDIVILLRSEKGVAQVICDELKRNGIDAFAQADSGFFDTWEIQTMLAFLRITDNPLQDIPLATALCSPVYAFTPDELIEIKHAASQGNHDVSPQEDPNGIPQGDMIPQGDHVKNGLVMSGGSYYECIENYATAGEHMRQSIVLSDAEGGGASSARKAIEAKIRRVLTDLNQWRDMVAKTTVSELISIIMQDTGLLRIAGVMPGGELKQANLRALLERATAYEATTFKGLFHFIRYVERIEKTDADVISPGVTAAAQVRVMTIHKSKGLEFPVVFLSLMGRNFNKRDERDQVILHSELGIGPVYVDINRRTRTDTLPRMALSRKLSIERLSEELRVLYVALTRAREKLIITACVDGLEKHADKWRFAAELNNDGFEPDGASIATDEPLAIGTLPAYYRASARSFIDLIMPCVYVKPQLFDLRQIMVEARAKERVRQTKDRLEELQAIRAGHNYSGCEQEIKRTMWWRYPHAEAVSLPSKVSISEMKRLFYAQEHPDTVALRDFSVTFAPPEFLRKAKPATNTQRGTAIHIVMEHLNIFDAAQDVSALVKSLMERGILPQEMASIIPVGKIERFLVSPLADRMRASGKIYRETPFVMGLPAREVGLPTSNTLTQAQTADGQTIFGADADTSLEDEMILVHGIIDCYFEEQDRIVLVDYKSDHVTADTVQEACVRHQLQLSVYKKAINHMRHTPKQITSMLYFFAMDDAYEIEMA
jgi:ATP-dependent helicase/nuclease subunit A